jgi:transcription antitermination factor NusG
VIRPEIIIPGEGFSAAAQGSADSTAVSEIGDIVRCIREPFFGRLGKIKRMVPELMVVESETKVRVLEVEFTDGTTATVPRANIEAIEE